MTNIVDEYFERLCEASERFRSQVRQANELALIEKKRLTDAELAAEHHAAVLGVYRAKVHHEDVDRALDWMRTTLRFATRPHYFEDNGV